ncbi:MAG: BatA domain-containing protein [Pirellulaceae bacterium]
MSFLNIVLLGGTLAFLAPLVIHLLNRSKFQSVDWGAMHLLEAALQVNSRRFQWENWLLLLLRCLIPIIFAICLARPVLTSLRVDGAGGQKSVAILLDNSLSMQNGGSLPADDGTPQDSAFQQAKLQVESVVNEYRAAELSLWTIGGRPTDALAGTTFDPTRVRRQLAKIRPHGGPVDISASLTAGIAQLSRMTNPSKQLVVVSDFQASQWQNLSDAELDTLRSQLQAGEFNVHLSLMQVTAGVPSTDNVSVSIEDAATSSVLLGESYRTLVSVHNTGAIAVDDLRIVFSVDGRDLSSRTVQVPPGAVEQVVFGCEFTSRGWHHVAAQIDSSQGIPGDNRAEHVVHVVEPHSLLIIDPDGGKSLQHSSGYLQLALAPFQGDAPNAFILQVDRGQNLQADQLTTVSAVVLTDVPRLSDSLRDVLIDYVRDGGGLIIFPGPKLDVKWYNAELFEKERLLPLQFGERQKANAELPQKFARQPIQAPQLEIFNSQQAGDLSTLEITEWFKLAELAASPTAPDANSATTLLSLADGSSFLASRAFGDGLVLQCATSCADDWSNFPVRPSYVPLMQRIVTIAVNRRSTNPNIRIGEALTLRYQPPAGTEPANLPPASILGPDALEIPWPVGATELVLGPTIPGLYRVVAAHSEIQEQLESATTPGMFTVRCPESESDLLPLSAPGMQRLADRLGAVTVNTVDQLITLDKQRSDGQEIWRWLLVLLVAFLFGEILLGQKITRGGA